MRSMMKKDMTKEWKGEKETEKHDGWIRSKNGDGDL